MKRLISVFVSLLFVVLASVSYADTITIGNVEIEYNSVEDLQMIYKAVKERMASEYKTVLFDADTYNEVTYIVGETFPAGRYYVYPVVVSDTDTDLDVALYWWSVEEIDNYFCTGYVYAQWCDTIELTDGMKIEFEWDENQRGVCIALQQLPDTPINLMDVFK